jgi:hypothetical protein
VKEKKERRKERQATVKPEKPREQKRKSFFGFSEVKGRSFFHRFVSHYLHLKRAGMSLDFLHL